MRVLVIFCSSRLCFCCVLAAEMAVKAHELTAPHCSSQTKEMDPRPSPAPREYAVSSAVKFMKSPNTATVPKVYKEKFLMSKGRLVRW